MPVDYKKGKIYKIESLEGDCVYYGSTCELLSRRMAKHRDNYKNNRGGTRSIYVLCFDDAKIYLVENYPCNSKEELQAREAYYIKNNDCVNKCIPNRTNKEWYQDNREERLKKNKEWYQDNREEQLKKNKEWYQDNREEQLKKNKERYENIKHTQNYKDTVKKYREEHKEENKEYFKKWREENKEKIIQYKKEKKEYTQQYNKEYREKNKEIITRREICECGTYIQTYNKKRHLKSPLHKNLLSNPFINFKL